MGEHTHQRNRKVHDGSLEQNATVETHFLGGAVEDEPDQHWVQTEGEQEEHEGIPLVEEADHGADRIGDRMDKG